MFRSRQPSPGWFTRQYRSLIRAAHSHAELDVAMLLDAAMLPRTDTAGQDDVRETPTRMDPYCPDREVGYLTKGSDDGRPNPRPA